MTFSKAQFYECENPDCRLRFPVYEDASKIKRCPACRSDLHLAVSAVSQDENDKNLSIQNEWDVEVLLDNIRSAWNVGSIIRTSDGTGIKRLYLCGITPTPDNPKVGKTSLGAEGSVSWQRYNNGVHLAGELMSKKKLLWALECIPRATPLYELEIYPAKLPVVLVVGNEVCGVDPGILELCDQVISIPMLGKKQSYNVAVAFGMLVSVFLYRQSVSQGSRRILPST